jgi:hypothetical protein
MDFNNLNKIDFKKIINVVKSNYDKDAGLFTIVLVLIIFFGIKQFVQPAIMQLGDNLTKVGQKQSELKTYEDREKMTSSMQSQKNKQALPINIYKAPYPGMDTESASVELVQEIIKIIKETGNNRINQIDFATQELKDDAGTNSSEYSILSLNLSIEGPYESIQSALNEIYLMNYLVVIKKINSSPLENFNYELLKTDMTLDLYIKLSDSPDSADTASGATTMPLDGATPAPPPAGP